MNQKNTTRLTIGLSLAAFVFLAAGCNKAVADQTPEQKPYIVKTQTADDSMSLAYKLDYPAMVVSEQEAKIYAKTNGTISQAPFKTGDKVELGENLFKIDDVNGAGQTQGFSAYQVRQATLAAEQAASSYNLAQNNYNNLLITSSKDLRQAELAAEQAATGASNLDQTTSEAVKSAEIALQTAKLATEQASLSYENRKTILEQTEKDTATNAQLAAQTAVDGSGTILSALNNTLELDRISGGNLPYSSTLGALESQSMTTARSAYKDAKSAYDAYRQNPPQDVNARIDAALNVVNKTKLVADASKTVLENTPSSSALPMSSAAGLSLTSLQTAVSGYQSQMNAAVTQLNSAKQGLNSLGLNNDATLTSLEKAYELAKQQEVSAAQSLANLKAGNKAQTDNAGFGSQSAQNQLAGVKAKLDSQISVSKSQMDLARIQYENALTALQNVMDIHQTIAPMSGVLVKKAADVGNTVSAGQLLAIIGTPDRLKIQFFVDAEHYDGLAVGLPVTITDRDGVAASGTISSITPQADAVTKRFLIEAKLVDNKTGKFELGTIATVTVPYTRLAPQGALILPLSAVDVGQNGASIFLANENAAKKIQVEMGRIEGETAEVFPKDLAKNALIIVDGNRLLQDGDKIKLAD